MLNLKYLLVCLFLCTGFYSCFNNNGSGMNKPLAISKTNDLILVAGKNLWEGITGDTFRYYFESPFPITPNPEPIFNIRYFTFEQIDAEPLRRQLRTYLILINLSDTSTGEYKMFRSDLGEQKYSEMIKSGVNLMYGRDKWARDQLIVYLTGNNIEDLNKSISSNFSRITEKIYAHDESQLQAATFYSGENADLQNKISRDLGISVKIPKEYLQALYLENENMIWLRRDSKKSIINFIVSKIENKDVLTDKMQLVLQNINKFGKLVNADTKGSVLVANVKDMPVLEFTRSINGNEANEFRGIWEMTNDFMGGPYIAYLIENKITGDNIFFFGFTYGPGEDKKFYLQQLMAIAKTIDFTK
ncbi:MAG: DUF4837 family protein [Saprospiraceae bacterium]|nr:DUF4837 family protein [Saprospiraceae bacterium]